MSASNPSNPDATDPVDAAAAEWFVLRDRGFSPEQAEAFRRWLDADARNAETFAELEQTWAIMGSAPPRRDAEAIRPRIWPRYALAAALAAGLALALLKRAWLPASASSPAAPSNFAQTVVTGVGEQRVVTLPDGSVLHVNTDSALDVELGADRREVRLSRGEVQFQVVANPARPFVVRADGVEVHDIGTVFDVRLEPQSVDVLVTEGRVRLVDARSDRSMGAGERAVISRDGTPQIAAVDAAAMGRALAWRRQQLVFDSEPLAVIAEEFNRYNRHKLVIADPKLAARRFVGTFRTDDYGPLLRLLQSSFGVHVEDRGDETVLRSAP